MVESAVVVELGLGERNMQPNCIPVACVEKGGRHLNIHYPLFTRYFNRQPVSLSRPINSHQETEEADGR